MGDKEYLTVEEVAGRFGVNPTTVYRLAQRGTLPGFKVGNQWRFSQEMLELWVADQMTMERLKAKAGVTPAIATFEGGGDMLINVLNHTLDMGVGELQEISAQLDAKKLRLLAVVGDARLPQYPDVKTVKEQGIDLSVRKFRGLAGPKGTSKDVIAAWEAAVPKLLADPKYKALYTKNGLQPGFIPHAEYIRFMSDFGTQTEAFLKESGVIR